MKAFVQHSHVVSTFGQTGCKCEDSPHTWQVWTPIQSKYIAKSLSFLLLEGTDVTGGVHIDDLHGDFNSGALRGMSRWSTSSVHIQILFVGHP